MTTTTSAAMTSCQSASAVRRRVAVRRRNTTKRGIMKSMAVMRSNGERSTSLDCAGETTKGLDVDVDAAEDGRRAVLRLASVASVAAAAAGTGLGVSPSAHAGIPDVAEVLPTSAKLSGFVTFLTNKTSTPALRAGTIKIPYSIDLPANKGWKAQPVANAVSGNYCQPRCDEPWVEVKFGSEAQGKVQVIAAPAKKLIGSTTLEPTVKDLGDPTTIIAAFGEFVTGNVPVEPEEVVSTSVREANGKMYYEYELQGPRQWATGPHSFASVTTSGEVVLLLTVAATDKQWGAAKESLKDICESFAA